MSTDDSISEDVSSSGGLSHCHADTNGEGGKGSQASLASSASSASGLAGPDDACTRTSQTTGGAVESRAVTATPACIPHKIRSLCLSTEEAFGQGRSLPFINPSSLDTLRALVKEIQSSGETDPEMWKDCEGRWLHLFQLVEKQYQEQILAQQEQYQCQIQLIQDEIKALVQLQNRQCSGLPHADSPSPPVNANNKEYPSLSITTQPPLSTDLPYGSRLFSAPDPPPLSSNSPSPDPRRSSALNLGEGADERAVTVMSSGYGTLAAWETGLEQIGSPPGGVEEEAGRGREDHRGSPTPQEDTETTLIGCEQSSANEMTAKGVSASSRSFPNQHTTSKISSQPLTSWAQRHKLRPKKSAAGLGQASSPQTPELQERPTSPRDRDEPLEQMDLQDQHRTTAPPSTSSFPLRRSDSLLSEASGLTYWRLEESELYHPLPDSFDSGAYFRLQEASMSMTEDEEEPRPSLREIYQNKQRTESNRTDWDGSLTPSPVSPQVLTLDPTVHTRQSDRTSGFTSPSHFSSPSFPLQPHHLDPGLGPPVSPDSMAEGSINPGDTDCTSNTSSLSGAAPTPAKVHHPHGPRAPFTFWTRAQSQTPLDSQPHRARVPLASEEDGSHTHTSTLRPNSHSHARETRATPSGASRGRAGSPHMERAASVDNPVVISLLRQNLREKHSRHIADLKAYYESEIGTLKDQLNLRDLPQDLEKTNQALRERCDQLDRALIEASSRIQELETNNCILERKLADWPARYAVAGATVTALQQRLEESKCSGGEKEALAAGLSARVRQLEEAVQKAVRETEEQEARREREYKMLQDLLGEYDSLRKDHEGVKNNLVSTENNLFDANEQISELKRMISKLESQVKQLEHENKARSRYAPHSHSQPSGAGLYHHPDLLLSPSKHIREPENTYRRSPCPQSDQSNSIRKTSCPQTDQANGYRKSPRFPTDQSAGSNGPENSTSTSDSRRCSSPPVRDQLQEPWLAPEPAGGLQEPGRREGPLTPVMRALIELEETRTTESRAPWLACRRPTVGFVDIERVQERGRPMVDRGGAGLSREGGAPQSHGYGPERGAALLRAQRSLSPEGPRSSSLPPPGLRTFPPATPTKRETMMLAPLSAKSSPKRSPTENYSTAFGQLLPRQQYLHNRFDVPLDQSRLSSHSASPRKRLHFTALDRTEGPQQLGSGVADSSGSAAPSERGSRLGREEQGPGGYRPDLPDPGKDSPPQARLHSLADAERLFDELTQEKQQIEAALSRIPGAGGRVSLQTRLDEVALEKRLERVNQDLGSIRMTLKRFHILRSSANI